MRNVLNQFDKKDLIFVVGLIALLGIFSVGAGALVISHSPQKDAISRKNTQLQETSFNPNDPNPNFQKAVDTYKQNPTPDNLQALIEAAKLRNAVLHLEINQNPSAFLHDVLPASARTSLPKEVQLYLEKDVSLTGGVNWLHSDNFLTQKSTETYTLSSNDGNTYPLHYVSSLDFPALRSKIQISGIAIDNDVAVQQQTQLQNVSALPTPSSNPYHVEVIMVKLQGDTTVTQYTAADLTKTFSGSGDPNGNISVTDYYKQVSFGKINFTFTINDWITVSPPSGDCDLYKLGDAVSQAAANQGIVLDPTATRLYYFNASAGLSCLGDNGTIGVASNTSYAEIWITNYNLSDALVHELGHTLGLNHASYLACSTPNDYTNCEYTLSPANEYGDGYSEMGGKVLLQSFNGVQKMKLGLLHASNLQTVSASGTYTVQALEANSTDVQLLKIPKNDMQNWFYYVEYRNGAGIDANKQVPQSVMIHVWNDGPNSNDSSYPYHTYRVDPLLADGQSFTDAINKITIKMDSHDSNSAKVEVNFGASQNVSITPTGSSNSPTDTPTVEVPTDTPIQTQDMCSANALLQTCISSNTYCAIPAVGTCPIAQQCCSALTP